MLHINKPVIFRCEIPFRNDYIFYKVSLVKPYSLSARVGDGVIYYGKCFCHNGLVELNVSNILKDFAFNDNIAPEFDINLQEYRPQCTNVSLTTPTNVDSVEVQGFKDNSYKFKHIYVKVDFYRDNQFTSPIYSEEKEVSTLYIPQDKNIIEKELLLNGGDKLSHLNVQNLQNITSKVLPHIPLLDTDNYFLGVDVFTSNEYSRNQGVFAIGANPISNFRFNSQSAGVHSINLKLSDLYKINYDRVIITTVNQNVFNGGNASVVYENFVIGGNASGNFRNTINGGVANNEDHEVIEIHEQDYNLYLMNATELQTPNTLRGMKRKIAIIDECPSDFYVCWQNEMGSPMSFGFDGKCFTSINKNNINIKNYYDFTRNVKTTIKQTFNLTSGILNDDEYNEIQSIFTSRYIYVYDVKKDKGCYVNLVNNDYEHKRFKTEKKALFINLQLENCEEINY